MSEGTDSRENGQCKGPEAGSRLDAGGTVRSPAWLEHKNQEGKWQKIMSKREVGMIATALMAVARNLDFILSVKKSHCWTSLVVQWIRICLPVQGTWVRPLIWDDLTCLGTAKPAHHNC